MRIESGRFRGRNLPAVRGARPVPGRLRRSLFSVLADEVDGARVLDLFAGVGGLGLEALSRGAAQVVLVEKDRASAEALERWIETVGVADEARVLCRDALVGALPTGPFDLVFLDPPFELWKETSVADLVARAAAATAPDGRLALKLPARQELPVGVGWRLLQRRDMGSVGWALLAPD